jgi:hypothetical protein
MLLDIARGGDHGALGGAAMLVTRHPECIEVVMRTQ